MKTENMPKWENYNSTAQVEYKKDGKERPPLTGRKRYAPKGLYEQSWDKVQDAYGKATLTPYYIEAITSDAPGDVEFGTYGLYSATTHQGSVYKSSQMAIPFLVDILSNGTGDAAEIACHFLARIALGENHFINTPATVYKTKYFRSVNKYRKDILTYYNRTNSVEAMRLLGFMPGLLPDYLDLSMTHAVSCVDGDEHSAFVWQASALITQGFIAAERNYPEKGYPQEARLVDADNLVVSEHIAEVRALMNESPSLLVRGCAAICLVFTGIVDREILDFLAFLGEQKLHHVPWVWNDDFSDIAKQAWMYSADTETLIESNYFLTFEPERLTMAAARLFPQKIQKNRDDLSLLPNDLSELQKKLLRRILETSPRMLGSWHIAGLNMPLNEHSARRLLGISNELLCTEISGVPLWHLIEQSVLEDNPEVALKALKHVEVWPLLAEIYRPFNDEKVNELCTLNLADYYDEKNTLKREIILESILADALSMELDKIKPFLEEWLEKTRDLVDYDWRYKTKGQKIGIALLACARAGQLEKRYEPLVRPYHPVAGFSAFPVELLKEVLEQASKEHRDSILKKFRI